MSSGGSGSGGVDWVAITAVVAVLGAITAFGVFLVGDKLLCNLKGINVNFLKCDNQSESKSGAETPQSPPQITPLSESVKQDPISSSSPTSSSYPASQTPATVSPSPSSVKPSADDKPCTGEQNGNTINLEFLNHSCTFTGSFSSNNQERIYRFKIANPSNITLYLGNVNSEVGMFLYEDQTGTGVMSSRIEDGSAINSKMAIIDRPLNVGNYIVTIRSKVRGTPYSLQLVNNTSEAKNVEFLQGTILLNGSVSSNNQQRYYRFKLANPSDINLSLDGVNSEVGMFLYEDKSGTGVISSRIEDGSAFKDRPAIIKRNLSVGHYIVVIGFKARDTNYTLTMSAP
jgi:hypothetical protein